MEITKLLRWLSLEGDVLVMVMSVLLLTLGNQMWTRYIPKYLEYLGAGAIIIGFYGSIKKLIEAIYQYLGGIVTDRVGSKNALILFSLISILGYVTYYVSQSWELLIVGTFLVLVWESMSTPAIFSLIGEALSRSRRAMGFSIQSILKRIPIIIAPPIGGLLIQTYGLPKGIRMGLLVSITTTTIAIAVQKKFYTMMKSEEKPSTANLGEIWRKMNLRLKKLLISDILARISANMVKVYIILYVMNILGSTSLDFGLLISIQVTTSILSYLPAAKLADIYGRKPFVAATFAFFSLFPLTFILIPNANLLPLSFIVAGLREIGEPARKALIVDLAGNEDRGKIIGLYYMIRAIMNIFAPIMGGFLWTISPGTPFLTAFVIGLTGLLFFMLS